MLHVEREPDTLTQKKLSSKNFLGALSAKSLRKADDEEKPDLV